MTSITDCPDFNYKFGLEIQRSMDCIHNHGDNSDILRPIPDVTSSAAFIVHLIMFAAAYSV